MTSWTSALPVVLAAALVLLVPGVLVTLAGGLRGIRALGLAAPLSVTVISVSAVVSGLAGVRFGPWSVAVGTATAAALAVAVSWGSRRVHPRRWHRRGDGRPDPLHATAAGGAGAVAGGLCAALAVVRGIPRPDTVPQTYDAVFHLSAVWQVLQTEDASSLTLGTVAAPDDAAVFYPAAWHGTCALVADVAGSSIPVAANVLSLVIVAVVWPLSSVLFVREVVGARPGLLFAAGLLSAGFGATPYLLLSYGTLWPNGLAVALLPAALACAAAVLTPFARDSLGRFRGLLWGAAAAPGLVLAHPNAVVSAMLLVTVMGFVALWRWARGDGALSPARLAGAISGIAVAAAVELWVIVQSPLFAATRGTSWRSRQSLAQATGEWLLVAPMRLPVPALVAALVVVGGVVAARHRGSRWLLLCHLAAGAAFVAVAGSDSAVVRALSGPWYDDSFRLAALVGVTGLPLAVLGLDHVAGMLPARAGLAARRGLVAAGLAVALAVVSGGMYASANGRVLATWYGGESLAGPSEQALLKRLPEWVPAGVSVAGNPWNGSALAQPLGSTEVLYPHLSGAWGADRDLVAQRLNRATEDPAVCPAVTRLNLGYVLDGQIEFWKGDYRQARYPGLAVQGASGFDLVATGGRLNLYRITACGQGASLAAGPSAAADLGS